MSRTLRSYIDPSVATLSNPSPSLTHHRDNPEATDPPLDEHEARVPIHSSADILTARRRGRELAAALGFSKPNVTLIATAIHEITRNIVEYANNGEVTITPLESGSKRGVKIVASDQGPGIADLSVVMRDGYSTGNGLGIGLPGTKRLMDEFEIHSQVGKGTTVIMKKWTL